MFAERLFFGAVYAPLEPLAAVALHPAKRAAVPSTPIVLMASRLRREPRERLNLIAVSFRGARYRLATSGLMRSTLRHSGGAVEHRAVASPFEVMWSPRRRQRLLALQRLEIALLALPLRCGA